MLIMYFKLTIVLKRAAKMQLANYCNIYSLEQRNTPLQHLLGGFQSH